MKISIFSWKFQFLSENSTKVIKFQFFCSSSGEDGEKEVSAKKKAKKDKNSRRNIRKIKDDTELDDATIQARKEEEERIQRLKERLIKQRWGNQDKKNVIVIESDEEDAIDALNKKVN